MTINHCGRTPHLVRQSVAVRRRAGRWSAAAAALLLALAGCGDGSGHTRGLSQEDCARMGGQRCYTLTQVRAAYGLDDLTAAGLTGRGSTVAVLLPALATHLVSDVQQMSDQVGLPAAEIEIISWGEPQAAVSFAEQVGVMEGSGDVQLIHAAAPEAKILYVQTAAGRHLNGLPELMAAMEWLVGHRPDVDVISLSYGAPEPSVTLEMGTLRRGLLAAHKAGVTVVAAAGNYGPVGFNADDTMMTSPVVYWPASDPLVTSVGGTRVFLDADGRHTRPEEVWTSQNGRATGGGRSALFPRPAYQDRGVSPGGRQVPDLATIAADDNRRWIYLTDPTAPSKAGWVPGPGTSLAAPLIAGIVATASAAADHRLGDINPILYRAAPTTAGLTDLLTGCNTLRNTKTDPSLSTITGSCARPGPDPVSGLGALHDAPQLVAALTAAGQPGRR